MSADDRALHDALTSDRPYRKAMSPFEAKETIVKGNGTDFDPEVVGAFLAAFRFGEMELRSAVA
jgi:HD-GYP domain-containing protein (c-di-GMP phosphodiesterase class II)